jgi:hypothetical protein
MDPSSPIHDHFNWDNTDAAHKYRLHQASELANAVRTTVTGRLSLSSPLQSFVPAYIHTKVVSQTRPAYVKVTTALAPVNRAGTLADIVSKLRVIELRYGNLGFSELVAVFDEIKRLHGLYHR